MAGFFLFFVVGLVAIDHNAPWGVYAVTVAGGLNGILVLVLCCRRVWFHRRPRPVQIQLAAFSWIVNVAIFIASVKFGW